MAEPDGQNGVQNVAPPPLGGGARFVDPGKKPKKNTTVIISAAVGLVLVAGLVVTGLAGLWYVGVKTPMQKVVIQAAVCGNKDVDSYNSLINSEPLGDYINQIDALASGIENRGGNENDATCQYILWSIAHMETNEAKQKLYLNNIEKLNAKGDYPDNRIYNLRDINLM